MARGTIGYIFCVWLCNMNIVIKLVLYVYLYFCLTRHVELASFVATGSLQELFESVNKAYEFLCSQAKITEGPNPQNIVLILKAQSILFSRYKNGESEPHDSLHICLRSCVGSRPSDHYFRSVCLSVCLFVCLFVQSFSQPSLIRFRSN